MIGKIGWLLVQPLSLTFLMILAALLLVMLRRVRLAGAILSLAVLLLFGTLFTSVGAWGLQVLEARYKRPELPANVQCMVVLGGAFDLEVTAGRGGFEVNQSADRFIETARLARLFPGARILVSGGDGSFSGTYRGDAELAGDFLSAMGIDPARLLVETRSRNTAENATETAAILKREQLADCLLITSAYHMPRAMALFRTERLSLTPWPTDYRASGHVELGIDFTQPTLNSQLTSTAAREWLALLVAYFSGRNSELVP
ncbi:uncharacterized SAM-binding protein YcdF (DUF218 family) [Rhizobium alvei]